MRDSTTEMRPRARRPRLRRLYSRPNHGQRVHAFIDQPIDAMRRREDFPPGSRCGPRETLTGIAFRIVACNEVPNVR